MATVSVGDAAQAEARPATVDKRYHRAKVFKSGNSLAVRLPAGTKLAAGMEMELIVEDGSNLSLRPVDAPKRKFNIDKVWGCAIGSGLQFIKPEDRVFAERRLLWDEMEKPKSSE